MNTFLEKVILLPNASSRIAAARDIRVARSVVRSEANSGDMTEHLVRGMIGHQGRKVGGRVDVAREPGAAQDQRLDAGAARALGVEGGARPMRCEGELEDRRWL